MKIKLLISVFVLILINGCTTLITQKPTLQDLQGEWESTGPALFYQLNITDKGSGYLAVVFDKETIKVYKLEELITLEQNFRARFIDTEEDEKPVDIIGTLIMGRLVLEGVSNHNEKIWFLNRNDLGIYRKMANARIGKHE